MRYYSLGWFAGGFATAMIAAASLDMAEAQSRGHGQGQGHYGQGDYRDRGYVVAQSRFGNATVRGAVRPTSLGPQVQLPGGAWIYCRRSCSETLRAETVDFWEAQQSQGGREQGLFIYLRRW